MEIASIDELVAYLRDRKPFLHERFGVTRIGVFGSFVQGGYSAESDIDLVLDIEKGKKNFLHRERALFKFGASDRNFQHLRANKKDNLGTRFTPSHAGGICPP